MMISTKGRYALRVMADLAEHRDGGYIPLNSIAERQEISEKYLENILKALVKDDLIKGVRGKHGGYMLVKEPSEYNLAEILESAEGTLAPVACLLPGSDECPRSHKCLTLPLWKVYERMVYGYFSGLTLQDLIDGRLLENE